MLVLEPAADGGAIKIGRKGTGDFEVVVHGRAAHAGLEPEKGVNALVEAAHQVLAIAELGRPEVGTTVTPTVAHAGTADNVVPAEARVHVDVRVTELAEAERVEAAMAALRAGRPGGPPRGASAGSTARRCRSRRRPTCSPWPRRSPSAIGVPIPVGVAVGGGSDGNFTAAIGVPTLDGLGVTGGGAHADHEYAETATMVDRTRLLTALIAALRDSADRHHWSVPHPSAAGASAPMGALATRYPDVVRSLSVSASWVLAAPGVTGRARATPPAPRVPPAR